MIVSVFRRRLRDGATFEDFIRAWEADEGFGVPARVFNSVSLDDPREVLSIGFVDLDAVDLASASAQVGPQESARHSRIDDVISSTVLHGFYDLRTEHDFTSTPRSIDPTEGESLLSPLRAERDAH